MRSARTPPSTFLFLHLHLSNSPGFENPSPSEGAAPHSTANDNRFLPAVDSLISVRSLQARTNALAEGQCSAALSGRFIGPPHRRCQRLMSTNRRIAPRILSRPQAPLFSGFCAVLEPQSYDVLTYLGIESLHTSWGSRAVKVPKEAKIIEDACRPFHADGRLRRDFHTINSCDFGRSFGSLSRTLCGTPRARRSLKGFRASARLKGLVE